MNDKYYLFREWKTGHEFKSFTKNQLEQYLETCCITSDVIIIKGKEIPVRKGFIIGEDNG